MKEKVDLEAFDIRQLAAKMIEADVDNVDLTIVSERGDECTLGISIRKIKMADGTVVRNVYDIPLLNPY